jgi:hypothetical protein
MDKKETFYNRAEVESGERVQCDNCFERTVFHLKDNYHEFSIGMSTVLECVAFAIRNGDLPKLPNSWLNDVDSQYRTNYSFDKDISYYDYEKRD